MDMNNNPEQNVNLDVKGDNASEKAYTDGKLQREIDEMDDALDALAVDWRMLQDRQTNRKQQIKTLEKEIKQQKGKLLGQKVLSMCAVVLRIVITAFVGILLIALILLIRDSDEVRLLEKKEAISSDYNVKIAAIDKSTDILKQQKVDLLRKVFAVESDRISVDSTVLTEQNRAELDDYIASLYRYPIERVKQRTYKGISYYQVIQRYDMEDGYLLNDAGNSSIYPGAVLRGDSLMQGTVDYALIGLNRTPMTLTCSKGGKSIRLEDVSYGTVAQAVDKLWTESNPNFSQKWEYSVRSVQNEKGLKIDLGVSLSADNMSFGTSYGMDYTNKKSTVAITFTETYFSIVADPQVSATHYFQTGCDLKSLGDYEPAYVSSVDYGRRFVIFVSTELSETELTAKLNANIKGVDISSDIGYIQKNIDSNCKILVYGGDSAKSLQSIDSNELGGIRGWWNELLNGKAGVVDDINKTIANDDSLVNPVPLAYHLNYLSDNSAVPAAAILNDNIFIAENAKLVTISLENVGSKAVVPGRFSLDSSADALGCALDKDWIQIASKGESSGKIQFIWDSSQSAALKGYFNDELASYFLAELPTETDNAWKLATNFLKRTDLHIYISDEVYEIELGDDMGLFKKSKKQTSESLQKFHEEKTDVKEETAVSTAKTLKEIHREKERQLKAERADFERERKLFEQNLDMGTMETKLNQVLQNIENIKTRNKKRWHRIMIVWLFAVIIAIGYIGYYKCIEFDEDKILTSYKEQKEAEYAEAEMQKQDMQSQIQSLTEELEGLMEQR